MEKKFYTVTVRDEQREYEEGTNYKLIAEEFQEEYSHPIVLVLEDDFTLQELHQRLRKDVSLHFVTTKDGIGHEAYRRSVCFLMIKAIHDVMEHTQIERVRIHFSVSAGFYCTVEGDVRVNRVFLEQVHLRMKELARANIPLQKINIHTEDAALMFQKYGMVDKERLFRYRRSSRVNVYRINEFEDYFYSYMVPHTGYLQNYSLHLYDEGFVIQMPTREDPNRLPPMEPSVKLFETIKKSVSWGDMQGIETIGALNDQITRGDMRETVLVQEAYHERQIAEIAKQIATRPDIKIVLIAGPSSSGKTTFSHRLSIQLRTNGFTPHPIGVDNYFVNREHTPRDEDGKYNFECLEAIDVAQFNQDIKALLVGKEVYLPVFDFKEGIRSLEERPKKLKPNDILVVEGIHCLNPKLTELLDDGNKFKIYISALTQINIDEHNPIPSREGRLIRRMVRDVRTRGASPKATLEMWPSVRRGEEQYIFPFQEEADVMFNSSLPYELAVLKQYVEPLLFGIERDCPEYIEAKRLLKFFDYFVGIGSENVPSTSLLREFIGGGCFRL